METEDNIVEFTGEWQGDEPNTALEYLLTSFDEDTLGVIIAGVLEFLTARSVLDGPFYLLTDDEKAITIFAANEDCDTIRSILPKNFLSWDQRAEEDFLTNTDPGDEQDESATESE